MNLICPEEKILNSFALALAAAYPARVVDRSLLDFGERKKPDLAAGVFTVMADGQPGSDLYEQMMKIIVVGQIQLPEQSLGVDVERAEMVMARDIKMLLQRQLRGPDMRIKGIEQSSQLEVPYGWVSLAIEVGPYDATEPLTEDEHVGNLADFLSFKADVDISRPHQSPTEHAKWVQEPPDYSTSKPDMQMQSALPRTTP